MKLEEKEVQWNTKKKKKRKDEVKVVIDLEALWLL